MLTITTHTFLFFKKKETWFYRGGPLEEGSYTVYCYAAENFPHSYSAYIPEQSTFIDLKASQADLFGRISKTFRYHIRKAQKLDLQVETLVLPSADDCKRFIASFNIFAESKKISAAHDRRIYSLQRSGRLIFTFLKRNGTVLTTHAYLHDQKKVILLYTYHNQPGTDSHERGLANKFLHWEDILFFKEKGFEYYDFGGINFETVPGISHFKMSFGGELYRAHNYIRVKSYLKPLNFLLKKLKR